MVKVGFIVEGETEAIILRSSAFIEFCKIINIEVLTTILPGKGVKGKDILKNSEKVRANEKRLTENEGANFIFIVRDLEDLDCIVKAKNEVASDGAYKIIAVKTIESWFMADTKALSSYMKTKIDITDPEKKHKNPIEHINKLSKEYTGRGIRDKLLFAKAMLKHGFSIVNAAEHPNCPSAKYFIDKLKSISEKQAI